MLDPTKIQTLDPTVLAPSKKHLNKYNHCEQEYIYKTAIRVLHNDDGDLPDSTTHLLPGTG